MTDEPDNEKAAKGRCSKCGERLRNCLCPPEAQEPDDDALIAERLLASIWYYGGFVAETHNERLLQQHMERVGLWPINGEADLIAKIDRLQAKVPETGEEPC